MRLPVKIHQPFGPFILETTCPKELIDALNKKVEDVCSDPEEMEKYCSSKKNVPNLLLRDIEVIYFAENFLREIGFADFVETLGDYYIENADNTNHYEHSSVKISIIPTDSSLRSTFKLCGDIRYADAWVNRYYSGDFTPLHDHGSDLAGIVILKVPEDLHEANIKNRDSEDDSTEERMGGNVQFINGPSRAFSPGEYMPDQEVGKVLLFPSWVPHLTYPLPVNSERRTLSFNLGSEHEYRNGFTAN